MICKALNDGTRWLVVTSTGVILARLAIGLRAEAAFRVAALFTEMEDESALGTPVPDPEEPSRY